MPFKNPPGLYNAWWKLLWREKRDSCLKEGVRGLCKPLASAAGSVGTRVKGGSALSCPQDSGRSRSRRRGGQGSAVSRAPAGASLHRSPSPAAPRPAYPGGAQRARGAGRPDKACSRLRLFPPLPPAPAAAAGAGGSASPSLLRPCEPRGRLHPPGR